MPDPSLAWIETAEDTEVTKDRYQYFMRPEPREHLGPIRLEEDRIFGRRVKVRDAKIGMVRNAKEDSRKKVKVYLEPYPHIRIEKAKPLQGWYKGKDEKKAVRPRPCFTEAVLTEPYGGWCPVGCKFCYINSGMRGYRGTGLMTVPLDYGEQIRSQLRTMRRGAAGYITSFTDPFLPLEKIYHNSQRCAEAFVEIGLPIFFLSRLEYPPWAYNLLRENPHSYAQMSISTSNQDDWRRLAPGALSLEELFKQTSKLRRLGIYVSIQVNPIVPGVTSNADIVRLFKKLADAGANHVIVKFVEAGYSWAPTMVGRMVKAFGERGKTFESLFTQNIGSERTVDEDYRMKAHKLFSATAKRLGLTYATCYEYRYERDESGKVISKTGVSIGREYTTAAQCHGPFIPVYSRRSAEEPFRPLEECPPSGCLYCAKENDGEPRCGDELAGAAKALKLVELKVPVK